MEKVAPNKHTRLSKSIISDLEKEAVMKVLDNEFLGMGSQVQEFEGMLLEFLGRPAVCVSSGTAALQLALQASGVKPGDEVIVQSLTYVASFQAITAIGAIPVACDVDPKSLCMDWRDVEKRITKKTKALMPVHYSGGVGELDDIYRIAKINNLIVIEDAAHAFGTTYKGLRVGGFGDITCFSFDGIKNITCGEGGCVVSSDLNFLNKVRDSRLLGVEDESQKRYLNKRSWDFEVSSQGWRYHMSNIMAAIGIEQLKRFNYLSNKRKKLSLQYTKLLSSFADITLIDHNYDHVVPHIFTIRFRNQTQRDHVIDKLKDSNIQFGLHYKPNHFLSKFKASYILKNVELAYSQLLTLPLHPDLEESDIDFICDVIQKSIIKFK